MHNKYKHIITAILILSFFVFPEILPAQQSDFGIMPGKTFLWFNNSKARINEKARPLVQIPPFCGKKKRKMGHDMPLSFGTGASFYSYKQYYLANDLQLNNDTTGIRAVGEANVQNTTSSEMRITFRPDVWVLPFLNVYGIIGYSQSSTNPNIEVYEVTIKDIPIIGDLVLEDTVSINDKLVYYGPVYGAGATISSGIKSFFFILDYHYTIIKPKDVEDILRSHNFGAKIGILLGQNQQTFKGSFWLGTMYINDNHRFSGEVDVKDILPGWENQLGEKATYSGIINAKQYWNLTMGGSVIVNKHHIVAVEVGYFRREQLTISYGFRF